MAAFRGIAMLAVGGFGLLLGALAPRAAGQTTTTQAATGTWLQVTGEDVYIRSRADANSLPVAQVPRDTLLRAVGRDAYGWYRIEPPAGVFSYVAAEYVDRRGPDAGIVSVRSGTLRVRVGSLVHDADPAQTEVQTLLERGASVQILGEQGAWLRIAPPPGVYMYVAAQHVRTIADDEAARLRTARPLASQLTSRETPVAAAVAGQAAPAAEPDLSGPWGQRLVAIESAIAAEGRKPLAEQAWSDAITGLEPLVAQREDPLVARLAEAWIGQLQRRSIEQEVVRAADDLRQRTAREQTQHERERQRLERAKQTATRATLAARGELRRSLALEARDGKRSYKLVDPLTGRMDAYLEITAEAKIDPEEFVGQYVGVRGVRRSEPGLGADVVRVEEIVALPAASPATQAASQPTRQTP